MTPSIYINLEDGVDAVAARIQRQRAMQVVLVCPKECHLFSNPNFLSALKQKTDALGKEVFILTMDPNGRDYAQQVGFGLREVPGASRMQAVSDIKPLHTKHSEIQPEAVAQPQQKANVLTATAKEIKNLAKIFTKNDNVSDPGIYEQPAAKFVPPQISSASQEQEFIPKDDKVEATVKDAIFPKELDDRMAQDHKKNFNFKKFIFALLFLAVLGLAVVYLVLPQATVVIYPKTETVSREMDVTIGTGIAQSDSTKLILPAVKVFEVMHATSTFQSQGKQQIGSKASGTVKIYNFTKIPVNLKSSTTVLQANGQAYTLAQDVQIKPSRYLNSSTKEVDPNSLGDSIQVTAINGGEDSNVPVGTRLEITNKVFGSKPQLLYARTDTAITGGVSRLVSVISSQDLTAAQDALKQNILDELRGNLKAKGLVLLDNAFSFQINGFLSNKPLGTEISNFTGDMTATVNGLAFDDKSMSQLIYDRVKQSISTNETLIPNSDINKSYVMKTIDLNAETGVVSLNFKGNAISAVNLAGISSQMAGKTPDEVNQMLNSKTEIDHIDITLAPSWQKAFPWFSQRITVKVAD